MTSSEELAIIQKWQKDSGHGYATDNDARDVDNYAHFLMVHHGIDYDAAVRRSMVVCSGIPCINSGTNWVAMYRLLKAGAQFFRDEVEICGMIYDVICHTEVVKNGDPDEQMFLLAQAVNHRDCLEYIARNYTPDDLHMKYFFTILKGCETPIHGTVSAWMVYGVDVACSVVQMKKHGMEKVMRVVKKKYV